LFNQICPSPDVPITPWAILSRSPRGVVGDLTTTLRARLGQAVPVRLSCSVVRDRDGKINGVLIIAQDERPKHLLQQQLMQAERLAAYKRLASALAAELKAPLAALTAEIDHLSTARRPGPDDDDGEPALSRLQEAAGRLSAIARHLREFGSPAHGAFTPLDLNEVVEKALLLVETQIGEAGIDLVRDLAPGLPPAQGDAHELEHVALSLIANACEAMQSEPHVRRLTLQTRAEQGQVILSVRDTGTGIPAELLPHVFDPLFTTKPPGSGLGLGLAYSREVVTRHGGTLEVRSQVGHGAAFTLALPALRNPGHHGGNA
jgi:two-component system sensor histidine kinase AtoS